MALVGTVTLLISFALCLISVCTLFVGAAMRMSSPSKASSVAWIGRMCSIAVSAALTVCCGILIICFMNGDNTIQYVIDNRSNSTGDLGWLYRLSGLWAGRQGSLLLWAWLISAFGAFLAARHLNDEKRLDDIAMGIMQTILLAFIALLFFSESNMPFIATPAEYFDANSQLIGSGLLGMNSLLEHWAMAVHPPALFIGYAGLAVPFAYALATLVCRDDSPMWVLRVNGITAFAWLFLGIGIGLGSIWAYVVLGWGGYWGWDPVENASLLSWLVCTALMHSFTMYRKFGTFKRWSVVCSCLAFMFVIVGTFISRSGIVQSVHAFAGDTVSLVLFVALIAVAFIAAVFGVFGFRKSFAATGSEEDDSNEADGSFFSREMGFFLNNVILVVGAFLLSYLTLSPALPGWMPLGGQSVGVETYNSLARPIGIVLLLIVALGPMMGWRKTDGKRFWRKVRIPGICAIVAFDALMAYFIAVLLPVYEMNINAGDTAAEEFAAYGPAWYYNGLAVLGFAVASLLFFNSIYLFARAIKGLRASNDAARFEYSSTSSQDEIRRGEDSPSSRRTLADLAREQKTNLQNDDSDDPGDINNAKPSGPLYCFRRQAPTFGGMLTHMALAVILVGLIGSSMYVTQHSGYLAASSTSSASKEFTIKDYSLVAVDANANDEGGDGYLYSVTLDITQNGSKIATVNPAVQVDPATMQQKLVADVVSSPLQDIFVVFRGMNAEDDFSLEVRVNPLISFVWIGFVLLIVGTAISCFATRTASREKRL